MSMLLEEVNKIPRIDKIAILAAALLFLGAIVAHRIYERSPAFDFYQIWGAAHVPALSAGTLTSPYAQEADFAKTLDAYNDATPEPHLSAGNELSHSVYPSGLQVPDPPLLFAIFSALPLDYASALKIWLAVEVALFVGAVVLLFSVRGQKWIKIGFVAAILMCFYEPFDWDLDLGNISSFQLFALTAAAFFCDKVLRNCSTKRAYAYGAGLMGFLVLNTMIKLHIGIVAFALMASFWMICGSKVFAASAAAGGAVGLAAKVFSCAHFGSWTLWEDWYEYARKFVLNLESVQNGNVSTSSFVATLLHEDTIIIVVLMSLALGLQTLWLVMRTKSAGEPFGQHLKKAMGVVLQDPYACASLAIVLTLALSPLVWLHYYVLSLLPVFWLIAISPAGGAIEILALLSLVASSGRLALFIKPDWRSEGLRFYASLGGWVPLWFGVILAIVQKIRNAEQTR